MRCMCHCAGEGSSITRTVEIRLEKVEFDVVRKYRKVLSCVVTGRENVAAGNGVASDSSLDVPILTTMNAHAHTHTYTYTPSCSLPLSLALTLLIRLDFNACQAMSGKSRDIAEYRYILFEVTPRQGCEKHAFGKC